MIFIDSKFKSVLNSVSNAQERYNLTALSDCRFYHCGRDIRFALFSDGPVSAHLVKVIRVLEHEYGIISGTCGDFEVYELAAPATCKWLVVVEEKYGHSHRRIFLRVDEKMIESRRFKRVQRLDYLRAALQRNFKRRRLAS